MKDRNKKLKLRVEKARERLDALNIKSQKHDFGLKYQEYLSDKDVHDRSSKRERLNNLWYCRVFDEDFTKKLEAFVLFKETQYK